VVGWEAIEHRRACDGMTSAGTIGGAICVGTTLCLDVEAEVGLESLEENGARELDVSSDESRSGERKKGE
jgi:hypothetical protein